jgi:8-amino-7-oxononanoate synthase
MQRPELTLHCRDLLESAINNQRLRTLPIHTPIDGRSVLYAVNPLPLGEGRVRENTNADNALTLGGTASNLSQRERETAPQGGGKPLLHFGSNDYLGLSHHPEVRAAQAMPSGSGASRMVAGNHPLYDTLERALATYYGMEAARVFASGYAANLGVIPALAGRSDLIVADRLVHASMLDGVTLSGAKLQRYRHQDITHAETLLNRYRGRYRHCLLLTEQVFSMDGDVTELAAWIALARRFDAWLMVDAAHALPGYHPIPAGVDLWIGTLSKALGGLGGYVCAASPVVEWITQGARSLTYSTALPPGVLAASLTALRIALAEPWRAKRAIAHAAEVASALGIPAHDSAILPLLVGSNAETLAYAQRLQEAGCLVPAIRPPTVPEGTARLRMSFQALHTDQDIATLIDALRAYA